MKFKLLAGQHIQADPDWEPSRQDRLTAETTGRAPRAPSRTYNQGDTVESDTDLVSKFGATKFQLLEGGRRRGAARSPGGPEGGVVTGPVGPGSVAPGGQVSEGLQECTSLEDRHVVSGLKSTEQPDASGKQVTGVRGVQPAVTHPTAESASLGNEPPRSAGAEPKPGTPAAAVQGLKEKEAEAQPARSRSLEQQYGSFDNMTVEDLRELAGEEEVNLGGATRKAEIIAALRQHDK
jgi:hypothetical protein